MKNIIIIIILFSMGSALIVVGCANKPAPSPVAQSCPAQVVAPVPKEPCDSLENENRRNQCEKMLEDMVFGMLESEIRTTFDSKRCDELPDNMATDCKSYIEKSGIEGPVSEKDISSYKNAMERLSFEEGYYDSSRCDSIGNSSYKGYCYSQLEGKVDEQKFWQIIQTGEASECGSLTTEKYRQMCESELN